MPRFYDSRHGRTLSRVGLCKWLPIIVGLGLVPELSRAADVPPLSTLPSPTDSRPIDGVGNNPMFPDFGSAGAGLLRLVPSDYGDGISSMAGAGRPDPRTLSNALGSQAGSMPNTRGLSGFFWAFGQLLDHDLSLTLTDQSAAAPMPIQPGDPLFGSAAVIPFNRSVVELGTGISVANPRNQTNSITAFIDASFVYGSDLSLTASLRADDGSGQLQTAPGNLLPTNGQLALDLEPLNDGLRVAGDVRVNENAALTALQTVFMREHNRLAAAIQAEQPGISGDDTFFAAREIVAAQMQAITYNEFLPILLGKTNGLGGYGGYDKTVNPGIAQEFSAALYRFGHSMVQDEFIVVHPDLSTSTVPLATCFFNPTCMLSSFDVESILAGLGMQPAQELDSKVVDALRNMLLTDFGAVGIDLLAINLQRGRDHGLASYLDVRAALGLGPIDLPAELTAAYGGNDIDLLVGALMENPLDDAIVGETMSWVLSDQFERLRAGDRYWFENPDFDGLGNPLFNDDLVAWLNQQTLGDLIKRNTGIDRKPGSVFFMTESILMAKSVPSPAPLVLLGPLLVVAYRMRRAR